MSTKCTSFTDDPDAPGCCSGCGDAREAHCRVCGGAGHVFDVLGHGPWDCWECRPLRDKTARSDPLSEESLQIIICSPNFRDYEKLMAREILNLRAPALVLSEEDKNALEYAIALVDQAGQSQAKHKYIVQCYEHGKRLRAIASRGKL